MVGMFTGYGVRERLRNQLAQPMQIKQKRP